MPTVLIKTFSPEPDLMLQLTGNEEHLERDLRAQGFTTGKMEDCDLSEPIGEPVEAATEKISGKPGIHVLMHVSSKHLTDAGKVFRVQKRWKDSFGQAHQPLKFSEPHVRTFALLMAIVHCRTDFFASQYIDFTKLFQFCKLVDFYEAHDVVTPWANIWYNQLYGQVPKEPSEEVKQWLFVTHVLKKQIAFDRLATLLHQQYGRLDMDQLLEAPLAGWVQDKIDENLLKAISDCVESLKLLLLRYQNTDPEGGVCRCWTNNCDAFTLANLILDLGRIKLWPLSVGVFRRHSLHAIHAKLTGIEEKRCEDHPAGYRPGKDCGLHDSITAIATKLWNTKAITMPKE